VTDKNSNCPHESTLDDLRGDVRKVLANVEKIDVMLRGDGEAVGLIGRMSVVEKQVNQQAEDRRVIKQTVLGGVILAILTSIGAAAIAVFKHGGSN